MIRICIGMAIAAFSISASAQYKYVGPDGKVVYSDQPPPSNVKGVQKTNIGGNTSAGGASNLPFALQGPSRNFPVTLYSAPSCGGCDEGRAFLSKRGIPFSEKTVTTPEDTAHLKEVAGSASIPVMLVGRNKQIGFEVGAWGSALDAAGYPETNVLPPSYKGPARAPAVPEKATPTAEAKAKPDAPGNAAPPAPAPAAPAGERPTWFKGF